MSKYLELKAQIEALEQQLETVRVEELDAEVVDMKKRIIAFGIRPEMLFSYEDLKPHRPSRVRTDSRAGKRPVKYEHNGHTWSGQGGMPNWFKAALATGKTQDEMLVKVKPS